MRTLLQALGSSRYVPVLADNILAMNVVGLHAFRELSPAPFQHFMNLIEEEQPNRYHAVRLR